MTTMSAWSPLRQRLFAALWVAALVSNIGTWMQNVGGTWLMTSLAPAPIMVALMQTATSLPVFLVGLPAGALADIVDRRRLLLFTQTWMLVAAAALAVLTFTGLTTPIWLLLCTFALGLGSAMNEPAWRVVPVELVAPAELPAAVTLNGIGINMARAIGPALGGLIVAALGPGAVFFLNALSFIAVIIVLFEWRRQPRPSALPAEPVLGAVRSGLRYMSYAPAVRAVLVRTGAFISCATALWALLPVVVNGQLAAGAVWYGILLGCLGLGAVIGAFFLPGLRQRVALNELAAGATVLFAMATAGLALGRNLALLCIVMAAAGVAWITIISGLNVAVLRVSPAWVQSRALAFFLIVFQGGMAVCSALWGAVAGRVGTPNALLLAAGGLLAGLVLGIRWYVTDTPGTDLRPSRHWPEPAVATPPHDGPVLVMLEYCIDPQRASEFDQAMQAVSHLRRRDGAVRWELYRDIADPGRYIETFVVDSWLEHLRQHERITIADRTIEDAARAFHIGAEPPTVSHLMVQT